ncbi:ABC transporter substrate-binding protein [Enterococcus timonensis]|uniref:ABC transporter substrate-binding protein n=1 Tax=Enterococcus timonensis TaxID=1852364 RepID=UPI0008DA48C5|nr:ABC transporter substrate-binding protein [Enterococcus timonensis]
MKKQKIILAGLITVGGLLFAGCKKEAVAQEGQMTIGVLQLVAHPSLDASYEGFKEGVKEGGVDAVYIYQNAQNAQDNLKSMAEKLVKDKPDLVLGISTPAAQSLANETQDIPIVVTAVTDLEASKLVASNEKPGGNLTGTSDAVPVDKQIELLLSVTKDPETIGLIYNSGEANSKIQADLAEAEIKKAGLKVKTVTVNSTNDVQQAMTSLAKDVEGIFIPTDNTMASSAAIVGEIAKSEKVPVVTGWAEGETGGLCSIGIDYFALGKQTGLMAAKILLGEAQPSDMPVETQEHLQLVVDDKMAEALGIDPATIQEP